MRGGQHARRPLRASVYDVQWALLRDDYARTPLRALTSERGEDRAS
jgi:hypothetical protein